MIRSMTGFGKAECKYKGGRLIVELKTINHRFYELSARVPSSVSFLEDKMRGYINSKIKRGRVNLNLAIEGNHIFEKSLVVNKALAKRYYQILNELKGALAIKDDISLQQLVAFPEVVSYRSLEVETDKIWNYIKIALDKALEKLLKAREVEGAALRKDLSKRCKIISGLLAKIKYRSPFVVAEYKANLEKKIWQINTSVQLDSARLEAEVALFAKNCDITEEIIRLAAHIKDLNRVLSGAGEAGRRLDFIAQEMFREVNTIGTKAQDIKISKSVIQAKEQIEKIREQVQNVE